MTLTARQLQRRRELARMVARELPACGLTECQEEVVTGLANSHTVKELACDLHLSPKTIEYHKTRAYRVLGISDIAGLTRWAIRNGLVAPLFLACNLYAATALVTWSPSQGATGYRLHCGDCVFPTDQTSAVVSNLTGGVTYEFYVVATNSAGPSEPSERIKWLAPLEVTAWIETSPDLIYWDTLVATRAVAVTTNPAVFYRARMEVK